MFNLKLHHIGVATNDIKKELETFKNLGYVKENDFFIDEIQKIKGVFIISKNQPRLELLEDIDENGPIQKFLKKGVKFYHFAYETKNIEFDMKKILEEQKAFIITPIVNATYFKKICFLMLKNMMIIELVELK